ncbi:MAG TPA: thioredoxin family protein [Burkholderiales bacterium]|nr:thioredoxin family protein [Burkholderiales bacterium]
MRRITLRAWARHVFLPCLAIWVSAPAAATPIHTPHVDAELVADMRSVQGGRPLTLALRLQHEPGWHTYWRNPGDSGLPTSIRWELPEHFRVGPLRWPAPVRIAIPPLANFGYEGETLLLTEVATPARLSAGTRATIGAQAEWLVCREICLPGGARFRLSLPIVAAPPEPDPYWGPRIARARAELPQPLTGWSAKATLNAGSISIGLRQMQVGAPEIDRLTFFPFEDGIIENAAQQTLTRDADGYVLQVIAAPGLAPATTAAGLLVAEPGWGGSLRSAAEIELPVTVQDTTASPMTSVTLVIALLSALAGGVILNLMPCVFPVVSIKVLGFLERSHGDRRRLRLHGLAFGCGVLVCFWVLGLALVALRSAGTELGWGYQLQSPAVVSGLALLFFLLALNLSGVFEVGSFLQRVAGVARVHEGYGGSFLAGLLACVVATPCTAPFMGAALGYGLVQPAGTALLVFTALAVGMAGPYVLLSFLPALTRQLPRPGPWMQTLKQLLAFPLYLTVVWLAWVLGEQRGLSAVTHLLVALVLIGAGAWTWGWMGSARFRGSSPVPWAVATAVLMVGGAGIAWQGGVRAAVDQVQIGWSPYSDAALARARSEGRWVFVDFTAAWCVTCQVNKRLVLNADVVTRRFAQMRVTLMRADWTSRNARIGDALRRLGRSGVPVYALYSPGDAPPRLLPEVLTRDIVLRALDAAGPVAALNLRNRQEQP